MDKCVLARVSTAHKISTSLTMSPQVIIKRRDKRTPFRRGGTPKGPIQSRDSLNYQRYNYCLDPPPPHLRNPHSTITTMYYPLTVMTVTMT
jgi:hypothetical protein